MGDSIHVDASACDIRGYQDRSCTALEVCKSFCSCPLALVSVDCCSIDAVLVKLLDQTIRTVLGSCEDNASSNLLLLDDISDESAFVCFSNKHDLLSNPLNGNLFWTDINHHGLVEEGRCKVGDGFGHGCTEQQILPSFWEQLEHLANVANESHIEHLVGFVKNEEFNASKVDESLPDEVQQTARCCHQDVQSFL